MASADRDEIVSWRWASAIMILVAILALTTSILGIGRFPIIFDIFIVYVPAAVLLGSIVFQRLKHHPT